MKQIEKMSTVHTSSGNRVINFDLKFNNSSNSEILYFGFIIVEFMGKQVTFKIKILLK